MLFLWIIRQKEASHKEETRRKKWVKQKAGIGPRAKGRSVAYNNTHAGADGPAVRRKEVVVQGEK